MWTATTWIGKVQVGWHCEMASRWHRGTLRERIKSIQVVFYSSILAKLILCFRVINLCTLVMKIKSKTAAPCYSNGYSTWNPVQKHTNIQCQTHSSKTLVILKPQRPMPRFLVCSSPLSFSSFIASAQENSAASSGQLLSLKFPQTKWCIGSVTLTILPKQTAVMRKL